MAWTNEFNVLEWKVPAPTKSSRDQTNGAVGQPDFAGEARDKPEHDYAFIYFLSLVLDIGGESRAVCDLLRPWV